MIEAGVYDDPGAAEEAALLKLIEVRGIGCVIRTASPDEIRSNGLAT